MFPLLMPKIMMMYEIKPTTRPVKRIIEKFAQKDYNFKLVYHEKLSDSHTHKEPLFEFKND